MFAFSFRVSGNRDPAVSTILFFSRQKIREFVDSRVKIIENLFENVLPRAQTGQDTHYDNQMCHVRKKRPFLYYAYCSANAKSTCSSLRMLSTNRERKDQV